MWWFTRNSHNSEYQYRSVRRTPSQLDKRCSKLVRGLTTWPLTKMNLQVHKIQPTLTYSACGSAMAVEWRYMVGYREGIGQPSPVTKGTRERQLWGWGNIPRKFWKFILLDSMRWFSHRRRSGGRHNCTYLYLRAPEDRSQKKTSHEDRAPKDDSALIRFFVPGDLDLWPWHSNSNEVFVHCT